MSNILRYKSHKIGSVNSLKKANEILKEKRKDSQWSNNRKIVLCNQLASCKEFWYKFNNNTCYRDIILRLLNNKNEFTTLRNYCKTAYNWKELRNKDNKINGIIKKILNVSYDEETLLMLEEYKRNMISVNNIYNKAHKLNIKITCENIRNLVLEQLFLGNKDYFSKVRYKINYVDKNSSVCVYGIKLLKQNKILYIGTTTNKNQRFNTHRKNLKNESYHQLSKFIKSTDKEYVDWEFIVLATLTENDLKNFPEIQIHRWLSCVECQMIEKYHTDLYRCNNITVTF